MISFIIAAYNEEKHIVECIESCLNQEGVETEVVITDDGSTDSTWDVLKRHYSNNQRVRLYQFDKNRGKIHAYNNSYQHANGDYMAIMGADDINDPSRGIVQVKELDKHDLCIITLNKVNADNTSILEENPLRFSDEEKNEVDTHQMMVRPYGLPGIMFTKEFGDSIFPLPTDLVHEDWWIPFQATLRKPFLVLNNPLYLYRMHDNNTSGSNMNHEYTFEQRKRLAVRDLTYHENVKSALNARSIEKYNNILNLHMYMLNYMKSKFDDAGGSVVGFKKFLKEIKKFTFPIFQDSQMGMLLLYKINEYKFTLSEFGMLEEVSLIDEVIPHAKDNAQSYYKRISVINNIKHSIKSLLGVGGRQ